MLSVFWRIGIEMTDDHWSRVYRTKGADEVSWRQADVGQSLAWLHTAGLRPGARVVDVGAGASQLIDGLLDAGAKVAALDLTSDALQISKERLGARASQVDWIVGDVTTWRPKSRYDLWHDRAVFHFLNDPGRKAEYLRALTAALEPTGGAVISTFADDGPETCSGLPVARYGASDLAAQFERHFAVISAERSTHVTPKGVSQPFTTIILRREAAC